MRRRLPLLLCVLVLLSGCATRPLTESETAFLATTHGPDFDAEKMRLTKGALIGRWTMRWPVRPQIACRERIWPPEPGETASGRVAGMVWRNRLMVSRWFYTDDFLAGYPDTLPLTDAMFLAHEATHVWQWQQRSLTSYAPWKAAAEHGKSRDPYLFRVDPDVSFFDYGYEQQAGLVEEYVCCRALDPEGARTERLRQMLTPVFPSLARQSRVDQIRLPWADARTEGICS